MDFRQRVTLQLGEGWHIANDQDAAAVDGQGRARAVGGSGSGRFAGGIGPAESPDLLADGRRQLERHAIVAGRLAGDELSPRVPSAAEAQPLATHALQGGTTRAPAA